MTMRLAFTLALSLALDLACGGAKNGLPTDPDKIFTGPEVQVTTFGARGDGRTDDTAAIQAAIDALAPRGTLRFPPGTYRIDTSRGVLLKDDIRLELGEAVLTGANVNGARCRILHIEGKKNVAITGGSLVGSRAGAPEWGVGILASDAEDVLIEDVKVSDFFFDGILITGNRGCRRVMVRRVVAENNRRTGLAIPAASDVTVEASTFRGSRGQSPQAGANCEPNPGGEVRNVRFVRSTFTGNAGVGLYMHLGRGDAVADVLVEDSVVEGNDQGIAVSGAQGVSITGNRITGHAGRSKSGIALGDGTTRASIVSNQLEHNTRGIIAAGATAVEIRSNTVVGTAPPFSPAASEDADGIVCRGLQAPLADACQVTGNTVRSVGGSGILAQLVSSVRLRTNTVSDAGKRGIHLMATTDSEVASNEISGTGAETPRRYDAIELGTASHRNAVTQNTIRLGPHTHNAIGVCVACAGNQVSGNTVIPWGGQGVEPGVGSLQLLGHPRAQRLR